MKDRICFFLMMLCCLPSWCQSQEPPQDYLIIQFSTRFNSDEEVKETFFWILPIKELEGASQLYPLYLDGFSKDGYDRYKDGSQINLFTVTTSTNYDFQEEDLQTFASIKKLLRKRKNICSERTRHPTGFVETTRIFAIGVKGDFRRCQLASNDQTRIKYFGPIFLPDSKLEYLLIPDMKHKVLNILSKLKGFDKVNKLEGF